MYDPKKQLPIESKVSNTPDAHQLIATDRIIEMAKRLGISFGHGDPHERIRYFIKLGILPHAVRKSPSSQQSTINNQQSIHTSGHLPYWTLKRLIVIDRLKRSGASFTQIAEKFKRIDNLKAKEQSAYDQQIKPASDNRSAFKNVLQSSVALWGNSGLSEEKIEEKLKQHKQEIDKKLKFQKAEIKKELGIINELTDAKDITKSLTESELNTITGYQNYLKKDPQPYEPDPETLKTISEDFTSLEEKGSDPSAELQITNDKVQNSNHRSLTKPLFATTAAAFLVFFAILAFLQSPAVRQELNKAELEKAHIIASDTQENSEKLGAVLAASSEANKLYIDATTEFLGETTFLDPIIAPNVIYGLTGGTGISVTAGQNPVVSLDSTEIVTTVNSTSGTLTLKGSGGTSISTSGSTITISSSSSSSGDITAVNAGNGLTGGASSGDASLAVSLTSSGTSTTTTSASGLEFSSGLSLLRGCSNTQTLQWIAATATWDCATGGGSSSFTLSGDSGTDQTISSSDTLEVAGGTNGIDTAAGATDTITLNFDSTEVGTTTWGSASAVVWTFNAGTVDPTIDFNDGSVIFNEGGSDIDLRVEGDNNANLFTLDAGLFSGVGQISLGAAAQSTATAFVVVDNPAVTATSNQNFYKTYIDNNAAVTITGSTTSSIVASLAIDEPNITATGTATNGVTLYLSGAPTEGSSGNFALWVDDGQSRFENTPVSGSTTGSAVTVVPTYVVEATDITLSGLRLALDSNSNADSGDIFYGLNVDDFTTTSGPTEYGVRIGSGYDYQFYFELGTRDLRISATAPSAGTSPLTATIPALAADDTFCLATLANCFGGGGGAGVTYTSQTTNAITKFTSTAGQITSSSLTDDGTTLTLAANVNFTVTAGTGSITENFSPAGTTGTARALTVTPTFGIDATDQTLSGVYINPNTNSNGDSGDTLNGILIDTITASSAAEYGLQIGSGWDQNIYLNDTSTSVLLADGGTITVTDGTNTLCTITDGGTTGALNCTGNITGGSGSTVGFWSRSSTTLSPATSNDVVAISSNDTSNAVLALTSTGAATAPFTITANSVTTGTVLGLSATALTTGEILDVTGTWAPSDGSTNEAIDLNITHTPTSSADNFRAIDLDISDGTALGNTVYAFDTTLTLTGNAAKTGVGYYSDITTSSTTGDTLIGFDAFSATSTGGILAGATTRNVYGVRSRPNVGAESGAGTTNVFGFYTNSSGDVAASGTFNAYGSYIANGTYDTDGTSTAYGLYVESITGADNNYTAVFAGGNVGIGDTSPGAPLEVGDGTDSLQVSSVGDLTFVDANGGASITGPAGGAFSILGGASQAITITAAAASTWGTSSGDITLNSGDEIVLADTDTLIIGGHAGDVAYNVISDSGGSPGAGAVNSDDDLYIEGDLELDGTSINAASATLVVSSCTGCGGGTAAWSALTAPTGDLNLTFDAGETNTFTLSETTDTLWTFTGTAFTTGEVFDISTTHAPADGSTNEAIDINITHTPTSSADNFRAIDLDISDGTALGNTVYAFDTTLTLTGNAAKTGYGYYGLTTTSSTTADTLYGGYFSATRTAAAAGTTTGIYGLTTSTSTTADTLITLDLSATQSGASTSGTKNVYGLRNQPTTTGANTSTAVVNLYGNYVNPSTTTSTTATVNNYGEYIGGTATITSTGTVNRYGLYVANASMNTTGTSTQYGLYLEDVTGADTNIELNLASTSPTIAIGNTGTLSITDGTNTLMSIIDNGSLADAQVQAANFVQLNNYFGDEFITWFTDRSADLANAAGDSESWYFNEETICTLIKVDDVVNGIAQINCTPGHNGTIYIGRDAAGTTNDTIAAANKPVILMKVKPETASATENFGVGMGDSIVGADNNGDGIYFFNNGGTTWTGRTVSSEAGGSSTNVTCSGQTISTTQYALLKIEVTSTSNVNFYVDADVSDGISFTSCGSATTENNIPDSAESLVLGVSSSAGTPPILNIDFVRFWQDDPPAGQSQLASSAPKAFDNIGNSDLAEPYLTETGEEYEPGTVVSIVPNRTAHVRPSQTVYDSKSLGIVSTSPGVLLGGDETDGTVRVALAGRVPAKVSAENGPIEAGDYLTSSSVSGVAMKATKPGPTIGKALEDYQSNGIGKILTFVSISYADPEGILANLTEEWSVLVSQNLEQSQQLNQEAADLHALLAEDIAKAETLLAQLENTYVPTEEEITSLVKNEVNKQLISLGYVDYEATSSAEATSSSVLAAQTSKTLADLDALLQTTNYNLPTLTVTGNTQLAQTQIAGTLSQDGTLIIDYGRQINVLGSTLYLQNDPYAGDCGIQGDSLSLSKGGSLNSCLLVDIGAGKLTIDQKGNIVAKGNIEAAGIVLSESINNSTIGSTQIPANQQQVTIYTSALRPNAKVLITATGPTGGKSLYLASKSDYESFTVAIENGPATQNIKFDWLIVNTTQVSSN